MKKKLHIDGAQRGIKMGQPEKKFNVGLVKATIWKNKSREGNAYRTVSLNKSYQQNGEWKNCNSFGENDINKAIQVLEEARNYLHGGSEEVAA